MSATDGEQIKKQMQDKCRKTQKHLQSCSYSV